MDNIIDSMGAEVLYKKKKIDTLIKVNTKGKCRSVLSVYIPLLPSSVIPIMATERFREVGLYLWRIDNKITLLTK